MEAIGIGSWSRREPANERYLLHDDASTHSHAGGPAGASWGCGGVVRLPRFALHGRDTHGY